MKNSTFLRNSFFAGAFILLSSAMVSCDNIDDDDRYIEVETVSPTRAILIEDYTGQYCINCPNAHEVIENIEEQYGDAVVTVSIHPANGYGSLTLSTKATNFDEGKVGLATREGSIFARNNDVPTSLPYGIINGRVRGEYGSWATLAKSELITPSSLEINISSRVDKSSNEVAIDVELLPEDNLDGDLMVWIVENKIEALQMLPSGSTNNSYVHNNVFRATVNGTAGESLSLEKGVSHNSSYTIEIRDNNEEKWNPDNLYVVAFLKTANGVEQVKRVKADSAN
ncbi:MAG: Omp28 family outer membrane lipoprotein [Muribaculaceae bacterium]|nr:Omp28 family outer membrane lipoprotein [Muribaculaceae bacterium]